MPMPKLLSSPVMQNSSVQEEKAEIQILKRDEWTLKGWFLNNSPSASPTTMKESKKASHIVEALKSQLDRLFLHLL